MATFLLYAHSGWRYVVLLVVIITLVKMLVGWLGKQKWSSLDTNLLLASRVTVYIQIALGLVLYILLQYWNNMRFTGEHVVMALLAMGGIEFGAARARKVAGDTNKFKFASIGFIIAFVLIYLALATVGGLFAASTG